MKIIRTLSQTELDHALEKLEAELIIIKEQNFYYFNDTNNPNNIDYIFVPNISDWTGLSSNNISFFSFIPPTLSKHIKETVVLKFINIANEIIKNNDSIK